MSIMVEWNSEKAEINLKKHNVSFEEDKTVFYDPNAKLIADPDHSEDEDRRKWPKKQECNIRILSIIIFLNV